VRKTRDLLEPGESLRKPLVKSRGGIQGRPRFKLYGGNVKPIFRVKHKLLSFTFSLGKASQNRKVRRKFGSFPKWSEAGRGEIRKGTNQCSSDFQQYLKTRGGAPSENLIKEGNSSSKENWAGEAVLRWGP